MSALDRQEGGDHYRELEIQPVEFITRNGIGFLEGCVIKRMCRWRHKNGQEDLRKAIHEIELLMELHGQRLQQVEERDTPEPTPLRVQTQWGYWPSGPPDGWIENSPETKEGPST